MSAIQREVPAVEPLIKLKLNSSYEDILKHSNNQTERQIYPPISTHKALPTPPQIKNPPQPEIIVRKTYTFKSIAKTEKTLRLVIEENGTIHLYATIFDDHISLQDIRNQQYGSIIKSGLPLRQTYSICVHNNEIAKARKRFKIGSEKKINYEIKNTTNVIKLSGEDKKFDLTLNEECRGKFICVNNDHFTIEVDSRLDPMHVWAVCLILIDVRK
jgi:hypothetical protein